MHRKFADFYSKEPYFTYLAENAVAIEEMKYEFST